MWLAGPRRSTYCESFRWPDRNPVAHPARLLLNDRNVKGGSYQIPLNPEG